MKAKEIIKSDKIEYHKISQEGRYLSGPWVILFLKDSGGEIAPTLAYHMRGEVVARISENHAWHSHSFTYLPNFAAQI